MSRVIYALLLLAVPARADTSPSQSQGALDLVLAPTPAGWCLVAILHEEWEI